MSQHCRANPCCGDRPCSGIPLPQHASGLPFHNKGTEAAVPQSAQEPAAWFVKDFADGWVHFDNEADAQREVDATGAMMMHGYPPYAAPQPVLSQPEVKAETTADVSCPCTLIEQDEDCPVGYPSMICGICEGKGHTTQEQVTALACEMIKIASDVGEPEDPFAAWESISLIQSQNSQFRKAADEALQAMSRCEHDGGFDREIGPIGCNLGDKCVCIGIYPIIAQSALCPLSDIPAQAGEVVPHGLRMQTIAAEIQALKLHPATGQEYDAGYIAARNDAFAIVHEALDNLPKAAGLSEATARRVLKLLDVYAPDVFSLEMAATVASAALSHLEDGADGE